MLEKMKNGEKRAPRSTQMNGQMKPLFPFSSFVKVENSKTEKITGNEHRLLNLVVDWICHFNQRSWFMSLIFPWLSYHDPLWCRSYNLGGKTTGTSEIVRSTGSLIFLLLRWISTSPTIAAESEEEFYIIVFYHHREKMSSDSYIRFQVWLRKLLLWLFFQPP